jgi:Ca-activated chloride channel family protein
MTSPQILTVAAWVIPLGVCLLLLLHLRRRRRVALALGDAELMTRLIGTDLRRVPWAAVLLVGAGAIAIGASLHLAVGPESDENEMPVGSPVVLVLDASNSMMAADLAPNRLTAQRLAARRLLEASPESAFGIVVFAGRAYTLAPPTHDRAALEMYLDALDPEIVTQTGSSVAAAVRQGIGLLIAGSGDAIGGSLVLISDGDGPEDRGDLDEVLQLASRAGVVIHTLGAATLAGAPVPSPTSAMPSVGEELVPSYMTTAGGTTIISRRGDELLRHLADQTGGLFVTLEDMDGVDRVARRLSGGPAGPDPASGVPAYAVLASLALVLLALQAGLSAAPERTQR